MRVAPDKNGYKIATYPLRTCKTCDLEGEYVWMMSHFEMVNGVLTTKFYVLCACKQRLLFDSEKKAADAWNKANAPEE